MTKRSHDLLRDVLDELCVTPIYTAVCARCGISAKSLWRYVRASQREDDSARYKFAWCDAEDWFHNHLKHAMRMSALMIEATARHHALHGFDEVQVFQGRVCWKEDPKLAGLSNDELAKLGRTDRYERKPDGSLVPLTVRRKPSDQLVLKMLSAHFPRTYGEKVEHQHSGIIPVMLVGRDGKMRPNSAFIPKRQDQAEDLVVTADSGPEDSQTMRIGMVVPERARSSEELEAEEAAYLANPPPTIEFRDEDDTVPPAQRDEKATAENAASLDAAAGVIGGKGEPTETASKPLRQPPGIGHGEVPPGGFKVC
jgi:hypothetical protein